MTDNADSHQSLLREEYIMEKQPGKSVNWWQTMPGILTAVASVIVAISGLIGVLYQVGLIGGGEQPLSVDKTLEKQKGHEAAIPRLEPAAPPKPKVATPPSETTLPAVESAATSPTTGEEGLKPMSEAFAIITNKKGEQVSVNANTLFVGPDKDTKGLQLGNGQTVNFEKIRSVEFLGIERTEWFKNYEDSAGLPKVRITLWSGQTISSTIQVPLGPAAGLPHFYFSGSSELGAVDIRPWVVKEIRFER